MRILITVLASALAVPVTAGAQPAHSFRELAELIEVGRGVVVITAPDGDVLAGQLVDISPASLSVFAGGRKVDGRRTGRMRDLYVREPRRVAISPLVSKSRTGAALSISW